MYRIFELVKIEAKRFNVEVLSSEVVGLIPKEALLDSLKYYQKANHETFDKKHDFGRSGNIIHSIFKITRF